MEFLELDPATGFQKLPGLANEPGPVGDAHGYCARVDIVEALVEGPFLGCIVDDECAVNGDGVGLDRGEVGAENGGFGMSVREFDCPSYGRNGEMMIIVNGKRNAS